MHNKPKVGDTFYLSQIFHHGEYPVVKVGVKYFYLDVLGRLYKFRIDNGKSVDLRDAVLYRDESAYKKEVEFEDCCRVLDRLSFWDAKKLGEEKVTKILNIMFDVTL